MSFTKYRFHKTGTRTTTTTSRTLSEWGYCTLMLWHRRQLL